MEKLRKVVLKLNCQLYTPKRNSKNPKISRDIGLEAESPKIMNRSNILPKNT